MDRFVQLMVKVNTEVDLPRTAADAAHDVLETCGLLNEIRPDLVAQTSRDGEYMRQGTNCCLEVYMDLLGDAAQLVTKYREPELARQRLQAEAKERERARLMAVLRQEAHDQSMKLAALAQHIARARQQPSGQGESRYHALLRQKVEVEAKLAESERKIDATVAGLVASRYKVFQRQHDLQKCPVCEYCNKEINRRYDNPLPPGRIRTLLHVWIRIWSAPGSRCFVLVFSFLHAHRIGCAQKAKESKRFEAEAKLAELKAGFGAKVVKNKGKKPGLKVAKVEVGKALHAAGIKKGDIVLGVNGEKMTTVAKFTALQKILPVRAAWQSQRFLSHAAQYSPLCP